MEKELINRYFSNSATPEEQQIVTRWLTDPSLKEEVLAMIESYWEETREEKITPPLFENILREAMEREKEQARILRLKTRRKLFVWASAACIAFLALGSWLGYSFSKGNDHVIPYEGGEFSKAETGKDGTTLIMLSDGSEVILNAASKLLFDKNLNIHQTVYLECEASFKLEKNNPLTIKTRDIITTAKGSQFNISASPSDSLVKVSVRKGKAKVKANTEKFPPMLKLYFPNRPDTAVASAKEEKTPKVIPLVKLRPVVVNEQEQMTFNKNNGSTDIGLSLQDAPGALPER